MSGGSVVWSGILVFSGVLASVPCLVRSVCCVCGVRGHKWWLMADDVAHLWMIVALCFVLVCRVVWTVGM